MKSIEKILEHNEKSIAQLPKEFQTDIAVAKGLLTTMSEGVLIEDRFGRIVHVNARLLSMLGYDEHELIGSDSSVLFQKRQRKKRSPKEAARYEAVLITRDKKEIAAQVSETAIRDGRKAVYRLLIFKELARFEDLEKRENYFKTLFDNSSEAIVVIDREGKIPYHSPRALETLGLKAVDLRNRQIFANIHSDDLSVAQELFQELIQNPDRIVTGEVRAKHGDGDWRWIKATGRNLLDDPIVGGIVASFHDITPRVLAESALRESEERFYLLMQHAPFGIQIFAMDGTLMQVNKAWESMWGARGEDVVGKYNALKDPQLEKLGLRPLIERAFSGEIQTLPETLYVPGQSNVPGEARWVRASYYFIPDSTGQPRNLVLLNEDVTQRHQTISALEESEEDLRLLTETASDVIVRINSRGEIVMINSAVERTFGYRKEDLIGKNITVLMPERLRESHIRSLNRYARTRQKHINWSGIELTGLHKTGRDVPVEVSFGEHEIGGELFFTGILRDITERKRVQAELLESEERFRNLWESAVEGVVIHDRGEILEVNPATLKLFGITREQAIGRSVLDFSPQENRDFLREQIEGDSLEPYQTFFVLPNGTRMHIEVIRHNIRYQGRDARIISMRNITDREEALQRLRQSEERFRSLIENASDIITVLDSNGIITYESASVERVLGYEPRELVGRNVFELIHPEDMPAVLDTFTRVLPTPGVNASAEFRFLHRDGSWRYLEAVGKSVIDESGQLIGIINSRDVTARKQDEEKIQRQLKRLDALRTIDIAINSSFDLRLSLNMILDRTLSLLEVDSADILLLNANTQALEYAAARGFRSDAIERSNVRVGEGLTGRALLSRNPVYVPDLRNSDIEFSRPEILAGESFISYFGVPLIVKGRPIGLLEVFHRSRLEPDRDWFDFLETIAGQAAIAVDNAHLFRDLQRTNMDLTLAYDVTIEGWSRAMDLRDKETEGHTQRVTDVTLQLAQAMGMDEKLLPHLRRGALLHDIGKIGVPDDILLKPGALTNEEWEVMRQHPRLAFEMLSPIEYLKPALDIPYCHHEKWDGSGYPRGLKGEEIPLAARIFAVVDVWDALRSDRPYRAGWPEEQVFEYIREQSGKHFDPKVVEAFLGLITRNLRG